MDESTGQQVRADTLREYYGYQWWVHPSGTFLALGYAGQYLIVSPELDLVVVFTSALREDEFFLPWRLFQTYISPAVGETPTLSRDASAAARLSDLVDRLAQGRKR